MPKTLEERVKRAESMLLILNDRYNGHLGKGDQERLNAAADEIARESVQ